MLKPLAPRDIRAPYVRRRGRRVVARSTGMLETLEQRKMLSVTVTTPLGSVAADYKDVSASIALPGTFATTNINGTVVRFVMQSGTNVPTSNVDILLYDQAIAGRSAAPISVANFLSYVGSGTYDGSFIHRAQNFLGDSGGDLASSPAAFLQGGGYNLANGIQPLATHAPIALEYAADRPNKAFTISYARTSDPDSATSGFFLNTQDNSSVFGQTGNQYAVFGDIIGGQAALTSYSNYQRVDIGNGISNLPIIPGSPQATPDTIIFVRSASVLANPSSVFTYTAASSNGAIASATVDANNHLVLDYLSPGSTTITLTGADLTGATATTTFTVNVTGPAPVTLSGATSTLVYLDADGTKTTYTYAGPGSAAFIFDGAAAPSTVGKTVTVSAATGQSLLLNALSITGATAKSSLSVKLLGGGTPGATLGSLSSGSIGKVNLAGVNVTGPLTITGGVSTLTLGGLTTSSASAVAITTQGAVTIGSASGGSLAITGNLKTLALGTTSGEIIGVNGSTGSVKVTGSLTGGSLSISSASGAISLLSATGTTISVGGAATTFSAKGVLAGGTVTLTGGVKSFTTSSLGNETITLGNAGAISLADATSVVFTGAFATSMAVKGALVNDSIFFDQNLVSFTAASMSNSSLGINGASKSITVKGAVLNSEIGAAGPIFTVKVDSLTNSLLRVDVGTSTPTGSSDFGTNSYIKSLTIANKSAALNGSDIFVSQVDSASIGGVPASAKPSIIVVVLAKAFKIAGPTGKVFSAKGITAATSTNVAAGLVSVGLVTADTTDTDLLTLTAL